MKNKKFIKNKVNILILIASILIICGIINKTYADQIIGFNEMAKWGYDYAYSQTYSELRNCIGNDDDGWYGNPQVMCLHSTNTNKGYMRPSVIIDINANGDNPESARVMTPYNETGYSLPNNKANAELAFLAYTAENTWGRDSEFKYIMQYFWFHRYISYLVPAGSGPLIDPSYLPVKIKPGKDDVTYDELSDKQQQLINQSQDYANNYGNFPEHYKARIILFSNGELQNRLIMYGTNCGTVSKQPTIKKYITTVKTGDNKEVKFSERDKMTEEEKRNKHPVFTWMKTRLEMNGKIKEIITPPTTIYVTYNIEVQGDENNQFPPNKNYSVTDNTVGELLSITSEDPNMDFTASKATIDISGPCTLQVKVKLQIPTYNLNIQENRAELIDRETREIVATSSDYVQVDKKEKEIKKEIHGNFKKYITAVNGKPVDDRSNKNDDDKNMNPVTVEKGDIVRYRIECENTSKEDLDSITFNDKMDAGLKCNGSNNVTIEFNNVNAGRTVTEDIDVEVTKSDMYLKNIKNELTFLEAQYHHMETFEYTTTDENGKEVTKKETIPVDYTFTPGDGVFNSNSNKDYVQLDDVEIAGDVWIDSNRNGIMDSSETRLAGIPVHISSPNRSTVTDGNGHYSFGKMPKGNTEYGIPGTTKKYDENSGYNNYNITFEYFGNKYEATTYVDGSGVTDAGMPNNWAVQSHALENGRNNFNHKFETIGNDIAYGGKGPTNATPLEFDKSGHVSTLKQTPETTMTATSLTLYLDYAYNDDLNTEKVDDIEYLRHINLGLVERPKADLNITKDLVNAVVTINGYKNTYTYDALKEPNNPKYKGEYMLATPYQLNIYEADYNFRVDNYEGLTIDPSNELDIVLNYKITVRNDTQVKGTNYEEMDMPITIREIADIHSDSLTIVGVDTEYRESYPNSKYNPSVPVNYPGYTSEFITHDSGGMGIVQTIGIGQEYTFGISYRVNKIDGAIITGRKVNTAQVAAYSVYYDSSQSLDVSNIAGLVDYDSNAANLRSDRYDINDESIYEDVAYNTKLDINIRPDDPPDDPPGTPPPPPPPPYDTSDYDSSRIIKGNVWEDLNNKNLTDDDDDDDDDELSQYGGNGIKENNEKNIKNLTVVLMEVVNSNGTEYLVDTGVRTKTDANGNYELRNIHAGNYVVRFVYGEDPNNLKLLEYEEDGNTRLSGRTIRYSGQDFKSTKYTAVDNKLEDIGNLNNEDKLVELYAFRDTKKQKGKQVSTAKDNEIRRLEVINYSTTTTYKEDSVLKGGADGTQEDINTSLQELAENTAMFADTKKFKLPIEDTTYDSVEYTNTANTEETSNGLTIYNYVADEVNFGLAERPYNRVELLDDIKEITAITSSGEELVHIEYDIIYLPAVTGVIRKTEINKARSQGFEEVQSFDKAPTTKGFRYVNIDSELMQGMKLIIKYQFAIVNIGQMDTSNTNLVQAVKDDRLPDVIECLNSQVNQNAFKFTEHTEEFNVPDKLLRAITYKEERNAINALKGNSELSKYKTYIENPDDDDEVITSDEEYKLGYFLGGAYYDKYNEATDVVVETRPDQMVTYIDNDLLYKPEDNVAIVVDETGHEVQGVKFLNYTVDEIAKLHLLKDITEDETDEENEKKLTDILNRSYISDNRNNLAFSLENGIINSRWYKYSKPYNYNGIVEFEDIFEEEDDDEEDEEDDDDDDDDEINRDEIFEMMPGLKDYEEEYRKAEEEDREDDFEIMGHKEFINPRAIHLIQIQASRILGTGVDLEDVVIDNLAEIVKLSNTVGRKSYIEILRPGERQFLGNPNQTNPNQTGFIGNTTDVLKLSREGETEQDSSVEYNNLVAIKEIDTSYTETVSFSPPTGLEKVEIKNIRNVKIISITIGVISVIALGAISTVVIIKNKKFYK